MEISNNITAEISNCVAKKYLEQYYKFVMCELEIKHELRSLSESEYDVSMRDVDFYKFSCYSLHFDHNVNILNAIEPKEYCFTNIIKYLKI